MIGVVVSIGKLLQKGKKIGIAPGAVAAYEAINFIHKRFNKNLEYTIENCKKTKEAKEFYEDLHKIITYLSLTNFNHQITPFTTPSSVEYLLFKILNIPLSHSVQTLSILNHYQIFQILTFNVEVENKEISKEIGNIHANIASLIVNGNKEEINEIFQT
ncbi:hypothetical protein ACTFIT_002743 [Dictyostelium discoideum]